MVSDSNASSPGPTGRPPMWNGSSQRKLARLYAYTNLSIEQIRKVLVAVHVFESDACPGKDSVNKRLNANFNKEPRWIRPRTKSDMSRRFAELISSPARSGSLKSRFGRGRSSSTSSSDSSQNPTDELAQGAYGVCQKVPVMQTTNVEALDSNLPTPGPLLADVAPSVSKGIWRRSTTMSNSTELSMTTLKRALSGCSDGFVRQVNVLVKQYTIPLTPVDDENMASPAAAAARKRTPLSPSTSCTFNDEDARPPDDIRPLPGDFLQMDLELQGRLPCLGAGSRDHDTWACYCRISNDIDTMNWVSLDGPSVEVRDVLRYGLDAAPDPNARDAYGNTLLHLLAARDVPSNMLLNAVDLSADPLATNSADQTFLHLLQDSWFLAPSRLASLLAKLDHGGFDIYAPDVFGRTIFHDIVSRVESSKEASGVLANCNRERYSRRDAWDVVPDHERQGSTGPRPILRVDTTFASPSIQTPSSGMFTDAHYTEHANLIRLIEDAHTNPLVEDHKGRNGLHCLAAVALSTDTLVLKYSDGQQQQQSSRPSTSSLSPSPSPFTSSPAVPSPLASSPMTPINAATVNVGTTSRGRKRKLGVSDADPNNPKPTSDASTRRLALRSEVLASLLAAGCDPNHRSTVDGSTPLMAFAASLPEEGDYKFPPVILSQLIEAGACVDARNRRGETALHVAARHGRKLAIRTLVRHGANVHVRDGEGRSVLEVLDEMIVGVGGGGGGLERDNAHYEACRAWLSGKEGRAVQSPTVAMEWARKREVDD